MNFGGDTFQLRTTVRQKICMSAEMKIVSLSAETCRSSSKLNCPHFLVPLAAGALNIPICLFGPCGRSQGTLSGRLHIRKRNRGVEGGTHTNQCRV